MFIGWLKFADVGELVKIAESVGWLADGYHVKLLMMHSPHLCYGAYEDGKLVGAIMAVGFHETAQMKYFIVRPDHQKNGLGRRLFKTLLGVLENDFRKIYLHANPELVPFFESFGFERRIDVGRYVNVGKVPPFNFTNAHAKELDAGNFESVIAAVDRETFGENRLQFLMDEMERTSSLKFSLRNGFQHSSVVNARHVYLGPWQVRAGCDEDAEKMMKGVLYFRGLKKVIADVPLGHAPITDLYEQYHFQKKMTYVHMSKGGDTIKFENIYAFSL